MYEHLYCKITKIFWVSLQKETLLAGMAIRIRDPQFFHKLSRIRIRYFRFGLCGFGFQIQIQIFSQNKYLNFKKGKILLEWQIQQISTNDKHLYEDFGIFNSLIIDAGNPLKNPESESVDF